MKKGLKKSLKYSGLKVGWFLVTTSSAAVLIERVGGLNVYGISVFLLGVSSYILGVEYIEQRELKEKLSEA